MKKRKNGVGDQGDKSRSSTSCQDEDYDDDERIKPRSSFETAFRGEERVTKTKRVSWGCCSESVECWSSWYSEVGDPTDSVAFVVVCSSGENEKEEEEDDEEDEGVEGEGGEEAAGEAVAFAAGS